MALATDTALTDAHMKVLEYAYRYFREHGVGPLYQNIWKHTGVAGEDIDRLFPHGLGSVYAWIGIPVQSTQGGCKPMAAVHVEDRREVYLDHNATTPLRPEVVNCLVDHYRNPLAFGNPSSSSVLGREAHEAVRKARMRISRRLGVEPGRIVFTGSGSEANNLAIKGVALRHMEKKGHIVSSRMEHPSVLRTLDYLSTLGFEVDWAEADGEGTALPESVRDKIRSDTILVCVMAANNEIGTINPLEEIGSICRDAGVPFMVDAVQGFGKIPLNPEKSGISLLSVSGHKIYAPKGVGALYASDAVSLVPLVHGGGQESGLRAGTENVGSIVAFGLAADLSHGEMEKENRRLRDLRDYFLDGLKSIVPGIIVNGSMTNRLPNNLSVGFPGVDGGSLLLSLNHIGVYVSSGSACSAGSPDASHVLKAIGVDTKRYGVLRFSLGLATRRDDLDYVLKYLPSIVDGLRNR